jgi:hypothetical protein
MIWRHAIRLLAIIVLFASNARTAIAQPVRFEELQIDWSAYQRLWTYPDQPFPGLGVPQRPLDPKMGTWAVDFACGVVRGPKGIDIFWGGNGIYVMKEKGNVRRVWQSYEWSFIRRVVYDGRLVWVAVQVPGHPARLLVVDPVSEEAAEVTAKDGLPQPTPFELSGKDFPMPDVDVAPIGPGTACVVGSSVGSSWIGIASAKSGQRGATLKIFHRGREATAEQKKKGDAVLVRDPNIRFVIEYALPVVVPDAKSGTSRTYVLVHRRTWMHPDGASELPLIVDPDERRVKVSPTEFTQKVMAVHNGALYYTRGGKNGSDEENKHSRAELWRATFPKLEHERVSGGINSSGEQECGVWFAPDGRVYTFDSGVHVAERPEGPYVSLDAKVPWRSREGQPLAPFIYESWHYGLLIRTFDLDAYRVMITPMPKQTR